MRFPKPTRGSVFLCLMPADLDGKHSATAAVQCLFAIGHVDEGLDWPSETVSKTPVRGFLLWVSLLMASPHSTGAVTFPLSASLRVFYHS